jgi:hypothetical protein
MGKKLPHLYDNYGIIAHKNTMIEGGFDQGGCNVAVVRQSQVVISSRQANPALLVQNLS